eukprot:TRINITY_DN859_c0_g2_i1.p1 TRINITY_DN859_c0_g2~~TRINITY_DN859_c0_g2_i1.p1  ORF type:complete len:252 (+),score=80.14 TRINITY_DN859_c0_g2_i1:61-816(+)
MSALGMYKALMLYGDDEMKWCNSIHSARCQKDDCTFQHLDQFAAVPRANRAHGLGMMIRHSRTLIADATRILHDAARRNASITTGHPWLPLVAKFRELGWVVPECPTRWAGGNVEDATYAAELIAMATCAAHTMHYDMRSAPELMIKTLLYLMGLELGWEADGAASEDTMPLLLDACDEGAGSEDECCTARCADNDSVGAVSDFTALGESPNLGPRCTSSPLMYRPLRRESSHFQMPKARSVVAKARHLWN